MGLNHSCLRAAFASVALGLVGSAATLPPALSQALAQPPTAPGSANPSQLDPAKSSETPPAESVIAATVNGEPITSAEIDQLLKESFRGRKIAPDALPRFQAEALRQAIDRRLVLQYLRRSKEGVTAEEVTSYLDQIKKSLELQKQSFADYLQKEQLTEDQLREKLLWQMSWRRYIARHITDEILQRRFERDRKHFDGGEVRVSHLLLKPPAHTDLAGNAAKLTEQAAAIKSSIDKGELTFAEAVQKHSQGTTENGGDLGFISRHGSMPEAFSRAAFNLKPGQVSPPVLSNFGVHLIYCTEQKPGDKTLADVRSAVEFAVIQDGFQFLANRERAKAQIAFTGDWPYLQPESGELVVPR